VSLFAIISDAAASASPILAWTPFLQPAPNAQHWWWLLLIPMSIGVSLAYKAIRVENLNQLPRETLRMAMQIVFGMIGLALALYVLVILILPHLPAE
jgi:nucleoside recognition membrane protein YjiH